MYALSPIEEYFCHLSELTEAFKENETLPNWDNNLPGLRTHLDAWENCKKYDNEIRVNHLDYEEYV